MAVITAPTNSPDDPQQPDWTQVIESLKDTADVQELHEFPKDQKQFEKIVLLLEGSTPQLAARQASTVLRGTTGNLMVN